MSFVRHTAEFTKGAQAKVFFSPGVGYGTFISNCLCSCTSCGAKSMVGFAGRTKDAGKKSRASLMSKECAPRGLLRIIDAGINQNPIE
jgi:hypothetical protein